MAEPQADASKASPSTLTERRTSVMREVIAEMREVRDNLGPRPSSHEVDSALKSVSAIEHDVIEKLEKLVASKCPPEIEELPFLALITLKEDRIRRDAEIKKRPFLEIIELDERTHFYDTIILQAERALVHPLETDTKIKEAISRQRQVYRDPSSLLKGSDYLSLSQFQEISPENASPESESPRSTATSPGRTRSFYSYQSSAGILSSTAALRQIAMVGSGTHSPRTAIIEKRKLSTIEEGNNKSNLQISPKLLEMIESAVRDDKDFFDASYGFNNSLAYVPETLGEIANLVDCNLSNNALVVLPDSIGKLKKLTKLIVQSNQLIELPSSLGELSNLVVLRVHHNYLEQLPVSIGQCTSLTELSAEFNSLKALPQSLGHLGNLKKLTLHLNQLRRMPRTMGGLVSLTELDLHFNSLEAIDDSLCLLPVLKRLNVSGNHFELKALPSDIGNLDTLVELDISENHIKVLPDSFGYLTNLTTLKVQGNPLRVPPMKVAEKGQLAIMEYMQQRVRATEKSTTMRKKKSGLGLLLSAFSNASDSSSSPNSGSGTANISDSSLGLSNRSLDAGEERGTIRRVQSLEAPKNPKSKLGTSKG